MNDVKNPNEVKNSVMKTLSGVQQLVEGALKELLSINPVVQESKQYIAMQKLNSDIRALVSAISGMKVS